MIPYLLYNYSIMKNGELVSMFEQLRLIDRMIGVEVAYRKRKPTRNDFDTCIITPVSYDVDIDEHTKVKVLSVGVARHVTVRDALKWDRESDVVLSVQRVTDEDILGYILLIPEYGKLAVADRTGDSYLGAQSTLGRFKSVIQSNKEYSVGYNIASSRDELKNAIKAWSLSEFTFSARPFNPSVTRQGQKVHEMLQANNAKMRGAIKPNKGDRLAYDDKGGLMWEIVGLAERGYAEYGAKGMTSDGQSVQISKASPTSGKLPFIKIFLSGLTTAQEVGRFLARALLDIHGTK